MIHVGINSSSTSPVVSSVDGHRKILEDFLRFVETGGNPICDGHEGRRSVAFVQAVYESSHTDQAVTLPNDS